MLLDLPEDIQLKVVSSLRQDDLAQLAATCTTMNKLTHPFLERTFRCVSCGETLLCPRDTLPPLRETRPRLSFFELRNGTKHMLQLDTRRGAANFHVLRHLTQTVFRNVRFPLPEQLQAVRALRCPSCFVFVGFRHNGIAGVAHDYIHHAFVELVDGQNRLVSLQGDLLTEREKTIRCSKPGCRAVLFDCDDVLPWTHVLSSSRLTDMNPYLEWDHSWAGPDTACHPAFFVKRLRSDSYRLSNIRPECLRQGFMQVGDVRCASCDSQIGWKILAELPESNEGLLHNYDQIGRFGIIRTAVTPSQPLPNIIV